MEIQRIESAELPQPVFVQNVGGTTLEIQDAVAAERLQNSVDVYGRHADGFADLHLREWQPELVPLRAINQLKASEDFQRQVRQAAGPRAPTDINDPLAEYCGIDQGITPESSPDIRPNLYECSQLVVRDESDLAIPGRDHVMVKHVKKQALQIGNVTRLMNSDDLALALCRVFRPDYESVNQDAAMRRTIANPDDDLIAFNSSRGDGECVKGRQIVFVDEASASKSLGEGGRGGDIIHRNTGFVTIAGSCSPSGLRECPGPTRIEHRLLGTASTVPQRFGRQALTIVEWSVRLSGT